MSKPKVSVLMPIYNTPLEHLRESVSSILNQTFTDFEFLIVNDSPDNQELSSFVKTFKDPRIRFFENEKNLGIEASTNFLIEESRGEYLAIFDHDDISLPERLEKEVTFLDSHPDYGMVSGQFEVFGVQNWTSQNPTKNEEIKEALKTVSCMSHTSLMIRKRVLDDNQIRYEKEFFPAASYRIITRIATVSKVANLEDVILRYRMDGNNTSIKHADQRVTARERIRSEYSGEIRKQRFEKTGRFEKVELLRTNGRTTSDNHYKTEKNKQTYFVKESEHSFEWEFRASKLAFDRNQENFSEPVEVFEENGYSYLVAKFEENSEPLDELVDGNKLSPEHIKIFTKDLEAILKTLRKIRIVHRDIVPRNFMVVNGRLKLIDFHFAVDFDNYEEYDYVKEDIIQILGLGEDFTPDENVWKWDDAASISKIIEFLGGKTPSSVKKLIGEREIMPRQEDLAVGIMSIYRLRIKTTEENQAMHQHISEMQKHIDAQQEYIKSVKKHVAALEQEVNKYRNSLEYKAKAKLRKIIKRNK